MKIRLIFYRCIRRVVLRKEMMPTAIKTDTSNAELHGIAAFDGLTYLLRQKAKKPLESDMIGREYEGVQATLEAE